MQYSEIKVDHLDGTPTFDSFEPLVLRAFQNGKRYTNKQMQNIVIKKLLNLNPQLNQTHTLKKLQQRAEFATSYLYSQYHLLNKVNHHEYQINQAGQNLIDRHLNYQELFDVIYNLPKTPKSKSKSNQTTPKIKSNNDESSPDLKTFDEKIQIQFQKYNQTIKTDLLNKIIQHTPEFFEQLVVILLSKMGYKGAHGTAIVTQLSNDNGIDGIINQDPLGTSTVYLQAKRYALDRHIQTPQIQSFRGALESKRASKGVFITTSDFSKGAKEEAERLSVIIINGQQLTDLMLQYQVGIQVRNTFKLMSIDNDFFEDN